MTAPLVVRLPRLPINWNDSPETFRRYWDQAMSAIENSLNAILAIPDIQAAVLAAQAAADQAQAAADSVTTDTSIQSSYVTDLTIEAFNDGADCHVDISNHNRVYGDGTIVAVLGGTISGLSHDTVVRIYYDQASRLGGSVTYLWDSDIGTVAQIGDRHAVGSVVTPRVAEVDTILGGGTPPPGYAIP